MSREVTPISEIPGEAPTPVQVGHSGWNLLHSMAAKYPMCPTPEVQTRMREFLNSFVYFYPCEMCSEHMRNEIETRTQSGTNATAFQNKLTLSGYMCDLHNSVNKLNFKPEYNCDPLNVLKRWHPTYPDFEDDSTHSPKTDSAKIIHTDDLDPESIMRRLKKCDMWCPKEQ